VALAIFDLVGVSLPVARARWPALAEGPSRAQPDQSRVERQISLGVGASLGGGSNWDRPTFTPGLEGTIQLVSALHALAAVGYAYVPQAESGAASVWLHGCPLRVGLSWRRRDGGLEARATAVLEVKWAVARDEYTSDSHVGVTGGTGLSLYYHIRLSPQFDVGLGAGVDVFFNRLSYEIGGTPLIATERLAGWIAIVGTWRMDR
jgi:hypothetical protein